jgi:hypothetical protein
MPTKNTKGLAAKAFEFSIEIENNPHFQGFFRLTKRGQFQGNTDL